MPGHSSQTGRNLAPANSRMYYLPTPLPGLPFKSKIAKLIKSRILSRTMSACAWHCQTFKNSLYIWLVYIHLLVLLISSKEGNDSISHKQYWQSLKQTRHRAGESPLFTSSCIILHEINRVPCKMRNRGVLIRT